MSKAFCKSIKILHSTFPLSNADPIFSVILINAWVIECLALNQIEDHTEYIVFFQEPVNSFIHYFFKYFIKI